MGLWGQLAQSGQSGRENQLGQCHRANLLALSGQSGLEEP
jgi:hypothetical protein